MGQKIITLSGAATDVLYALFFRGALTGGDLPSKSGAAELRELGCATSRAGHVKSCLKMGGPSSKAKYS